MEAPPTRKARGLPRAVKTILWQVVILGVLLALLIPSLNRARESARRSECLSRTRQIGLGMAQYEGNYGGVLPWRTGASRPDEAWRDLGMLFPRYVSDLAQVRQLRKDGA